MTPVDETLMDKCRRVLRDEPELIFTIGVTVFDGRPFVRISKPGALPRSKPVDLLPLIFGANGAKHSDMLELLAGIMKEEGR